MPRHSSRVPSYRLHKFSGQAVVTIDGHDRYLGLHGTLGSKQKYARLIHEWTANQHLPLSEGPPSTPAADLTINELALAFWEHAKRYYVKANGEPTGERQAVKYSLRPVVELYGDERVADFGPRKLKADGLQLRHRGSGPAGPVPWAVFGCRGTSLRADRGLLLTLLDAFDTRASRTHDRTYSESELIL